MRSRDFRGNLFVANLPPDLSEEALAEAFDPYGIVLSAFMPRDPASGEPLGYGFVDIVTERAQELAIAGMNGTLLKGHRIEVRRSERARSAKKRTLSAPRPRPARPARREPDAPGSSQEAWAPTVQRKRPGFTVEHRPLPRRF
jgi:RNA recognition motif-containing protein